MNDLDCMYVVVKSVKKQTSQPVSTAHNSLLNAESSASEFAHFIAE